ncbi:unnamed protein product [Malus baccata var. baccata]
MGLKKSMFRYADGTNKLLMFFGTLGSIGDGLLNPLMMYVLSEVINSYGKSQVTNADVDKFALRLFYVAIGVGLAAFVAERQTSKMRMEYLKSVLRREVSFFDTQTASSSTTFQVISIISSDATAVQVSLYKKIPDCLTYMSTFFFCHIFAFKLSWRLTLAAMPISVMFMAPGLVFGKILIGLVMKGIEAYGVAGGLAEQAISSVRTVYSYVGENQTLNRFSTVLQTVTELGIKVGLVKGLLMGSMGIIFIGWDGGHVFVAGSNVLMGGMSILSALPNLTAITEALAATTRILEMIDRVPSIDTEDKKGKALSHVRGETEFQDIYFNYPSRPDTTAKWLRSQVGLVNQEPVLFATFLKENILFGKEVASMEEVIIAAKAANAHDFIVKLPDEYDTQVCYLPFLESILVSMLTGQSGFQLFGGQKQRIIIARALLRDPKILLLDEGTSALDVQSKRVVQEAIDQASKGRTTIIIAHCLSTVRTTDLIFVLQAGTVQTAAQNEASDDFSSQIYEKPRRMRSVIPSLISFRSVTPSPAFNPTTMSTSMGTPYSFSVQYDPDDEIDDEDSKPPNYPPLSQWRLLKMNAPEWGQALLGCLGAIGSGAVQPINAYYVGSLISVYFFQDKSEIKSQSRVLSLIFLGIGVFNFFTNLFQHYNFAVMGEKLTTRVREQLLEKLLTFKIGWFDQDENTSAAIFFGVCFAYAVGLLLTWRLVLVMIAVQPLVIGSFYARNILMKSSGEKARKAQKQGSQLTSEAIINHRTITAFSSQKRILALFGATLKGPMKESIKQSYVSGAGLFSSQFFNTAATALAYWYGGRLLAFFILLFTACIIADARSMSSDPSKGNSAIQSVFAMRIKGRVEFRNVFFSYPTRPDQMIRKGLTLKIDVGKTLALVGGIGSGKSTIIGLIKRFYDPMKGMLYEQDVKNYKLRILRSHIALVSQEPTLFAGTVLKNIEYDCVVLQFHNMLTFLYFHIFCSGMDNGFDTYCGERGVQLSGGQKQRIATAQAILNDPSILLLDEATIQEALEKMMASRTCIVIAHQLSTIQKVNSIAVIQNGKVAEQGSHNKLISLGSNGAYYNLIKLQTGSPPPR